jgi:ATP-dependent Clp protease ATP-binding subunit ClpA
MFEQFTDRARRVVVLAQEEARMLNHNYIGAEHLLLGLTHEGEGVAAAALERMGISPDTIRQQVEEIIGAGQQAPTGHMPFTPRAKKVIELSLREALQLGEHNIGTEHLLLALIREGDGVAAQVLVRLGADLVRTRQLVIQLHQSYQASSDNPPVAAAASPTTPRAAWASQDISLPQGTDRARFTDQAWQLLLLTQDEARQFNHNYIGTEHLLLGFLREGGEIAARALESLGISLEAVRQQVEEIIGQGQQAPSGSIPFTPRARKVLELALREAGQLGHNYIRPEDVLLGLIREGDGVAAQVLVKLGADLNRTRQRVIQLLHDHLQSVPSAEKLPGGQPAETETELPGRFTDRARHSVSLAEGAATSLGSRAVGCEHLLLGLISDGGGVASLILAAMRIDLEALRRDMEQAGRGTRARPKPRLASAATEAIAMARSEAEQRGHAYVGTHHILLGLARQENGTAARALAARGASPDRISGLAGILLAFARQTTDAPPDAKPTADGPFARNLTRDAHAGRLDPVLGRGQEVGQVISALDAGAGVPLLVGEHGAGVSAVARGVVLASQRPGALGRLAGTEVWELDARGLIDSGDSSGDRVAALVAHVRAMGNVLLLVENAFTPVIVASGQAGRSAIPHLAPVLTGGELRVIATATPAEYQAGVPAGSPLGSALRVIEVDELAEEVTAEVLQDVRDRWESRHGVCITDEAIAAAVTLSSRHDPGSPLPRRAMNLVDRAAALVSTRMSRERLTQARDLLAEIRQRKEAFISAQDFERAAAERDREKQQLAAIAALEKWDPKKGERENMPDRPIGMVTEGDVAAVLAQPQAER